MHAMDYKVIKSSKELLSYVKTLDRKEKIAVDFEGEFNLHVYGEHLCLIQLFDGDGYYIIDPRSREMDSAALVSFFTHPVRKVWFELCSDNSLVLKNYGVSVANVDDVRAYALALGSMGNLVSIEEQYLGIKPEGGDKKKLQQTNWMKRPLTEEQISYALSDVVHLFNLEEALKAEAERHDVMKEAEALLKKARHLPDVKPGWTKICNWKFLSPEQRENVKEYFIARDVVAKRFNVPAFMVLDKHKISALGKACPKTMGEVFKIAGKLPPRFASALTQSLGKAFDRLHCGK